MQRRASMASGGGTLLELLGSQRAGSGAAAGRHRLLRQQSVQQQQQRPLADDEIFGPADGGAADYLWGLMDMEGEVEIIPRQGRALLTSVCYCS